MKQVKDLAGNIHNIEVVNSGELYLDGNKTSPIYHMAEHDTEEYEVWYEADALPDYPSTLRLEKGLVFSMMTQEQIMKELMDKVAAGKMTFEQAIAEAVRIARLNDSIKKVGTRAARVDRVAAVGDMSSLTELQVAYKKAAAKMSSAKRRAGDRFEKDPSYIKYKAEFEAIQSKKNDFYAQASKQEDYVEGLISIGASDSAIVQEYMTRKNKELTEEMMAVKARKSLTNDQLHSFISGQKAEAVDDIVAELDNYKPGLGKLYRERNAADQLFVKINRLARAVAISKKSDKTDR